MWKLMTGYKLAYLGATASLAMASLFKTATFFLLRYLVDNVIGQGNTSAFGSMQLTLGAIALGFLGLAFLEGSNTFLSGRLAAFAAEGIAMRLRNYLFDHIQRLSFSYHDKMQTGELIQRSTSDVDALRRFFADQAIGVGRIVLLFLINFIALLQLNTLLAWVSIIVVPIVFVTSIIFFRKVTKAYEAFQEQEARLSTVLQENLSGVRVVKAFARQDFERGKFEKENWEKYLRGRRLLLMHASFWPLSDILCGFQMLGGFFFAAWMAINGAITPGTYLAYAGLVVWLIWPMRNLGRLIVQTSTGLVSYGRVMEIVKQEREPLLDGQHIPAGNVKGEICFDHVGFHFSEGIPTLDDISFSIQPGKSIALMGPTGSGKSALVNLLPRFYEYTAGSITLDGLELKDYPRQFLRSQIGLVEQEPFLFSRTILENITYSVGHGVSQEEVETAAKAAAIHDVIMGFPDGYNTLVGEKGVTLSGGQKQRVAMARTFLKNPRILIMDDATSSVDTETEAAIQIALQNLMQDRTTFIIAHRVQSVRDADLIVVLDKGRIVQKGTHDELLKEDGIYRQIHDIQSRIEQELEKDITSATSVNEATL